MREELSFADELRRAMQDRGWDAKELARRTADTGKPISKGHIQKLASPNVDRPDTTLLMAWRLRKALGLNYWPSQSDVDEPEFSDKILSDLVKAAKQLGHHDRTLLLQAAQAWCPKESAPNNGQSVSRALPRSSRRRASAG
jgi:hypothetical protein